GRGESLHTHLDDLSGPLQEDQGAIVQNYQLDFRRYLHAFILPLGWVVIGGGLLLMAGLPILLHFSIVRPLNALSAGVRQMEAGDLNVQVAIHNQDEIGFLTHAFNRMASRLGKLVTGLEERVAERTAELEARNEELDAFAHTVAHDIKSPLTPIVAYAEMLAEDYAAQGDIQGLESLHKIASSGRKISHIVDELMLLAGLREMKAQFEPLDMAGIVAQVQERLAQMTEDCQAKIVLHATWPAALGYGPWVEEVWVNYLSNALKYGGRPEEEILPRIELGADPLPQAGQTERGYIRFWVRDNGPGLTSEEQAKLFTPFTRLDPIRTKGHGMGLSIVQRIVEKLEGQAGVESEMGQGSLFFFTLPSVAGANYDEPQA
ncbi:MAG: HAMP domain-containing sensor histidine kinase, partial [Chloroflexota bacterium]|nr:HAMP domain-containing sensor histidine kinase [Chloroflexota bacterium]